MLVAEIANPQKGDYVIDMCAAPGGKSLHIGDKMEGFGTVDARDISQYKVNLIEENIQRLNSINVQAKVQDATIFEVESECKADIVLADVPCSGYGVIGKKPEIKYRSTAQKEEELVILQRTILDKAAEYVKPRGVLVFSTCTIAKEENEENMMWFMNNHPFKLESIHEFTAGRTSLRNDRTWIFADASGSAWHRWVLYCKIQKEIIMTDIKSMTIDELKELMTQIGEKPFRAKQIYSWLHEHLVTSYDEMANLPKHLKQKLADYPITALETLDVQISKVDGTRKYLFRLSDGNMIESVLMRYKYGNSVCISSQAGCRMGCRFCASTIGGLTRNLLPSEMLDQIYRIQTSIGERISNVVVMGTGEPLDNYDNAAAIHPDADVKNGRTPYQPAKSLPLSTCGLVPRRCVSWQKKDFRSHWHCVAPRTESGKAAGSCCRSPDKYAIHEALACLPQLF